MRVTQQAKVETRHRILNAAKELFASQGYEATTTRQIAQQAKIAFGTVFNYFPTKEHIVSVLASEAVAAAHEELDANEPPPQSLEERLFALVARELRHLRPLRRFLRPVVELGRWSACPDGQTDATDFRCRHAETVDACLTAELGHDVSPLALQLYWTLYTGVLVSWTADESPNQEDTLALLDQSLRMFVAWLRAPRESHDTAIPVTSPTPEN